MWYQLYVLGVRWLSKPILKTFLRLPKDSPARMRITNYSRHCYTSLNAIEKKYLKRNYHYGDRKAKMLGQGEALEFLAELIVECGLTALTVLGFAYYIKLLFVNRYADFEDKISNLEDNIQKMKQNIDKKEQLIREN